MAEDGLSEVRSPFETTELCGVSREGRLEDGVACGWGCVACVERGDVRFVDRLMMSFP